MDVAELRTKKKHGLEEDGSAHSCVATLGENRSYELHLLVTHIQCIEVTV